MDDPQTKEEEHIPECTEVKLAYDLSAIPLLGGLFFPILYVMVLVKLGVLGTTQSFWLQKTFVRLRRRSLFPLFFIVIIGFLFPIWSESRKGSGDHDAQIMLKRIADAQSAYYATYKRYAPSLSTLVNTGYLPVYEFNQCTAPGIDSVVINGYLFQMTAGRAWTTNTFFLRCKPESAVCGVYCYTVDANRNIVTTEAY